MPSDLLVNILAGGVSGGVARFFVAPLDVVKIRFQTQIDPAKAVAHRPHYYYHSVRHAFSTIYKLEGIKGLWRGNLLAEVMWVTFAAAQFGSYTFFKDLAARTLGNPQSTAASLICGAAAGGSSTLIIYPLDLLRTRFAAQGIPVIYPTIGHAVASIYSTTGLRGFYYGVCPSLWQLVPHGGIQFFTYDVLSRVAAKRGAFIGDWAHPICGGVAGLFAKLLTYPMDVAKKRLQVHGLHLYKKGEVPAKCPGLGPTLKQLLIQEGPAALYKGLTPSLLKSTTQAALLFATYEQAKKLTRNMLS